MPMPTPRITTRMWGCDKSYCFISHNISLPWVKHHLSPLNKSQLPYRNISTARGSSLSAFVSSTTASCSKTCSPSSPSSVYHHPFSCIFHHFAHLSVPQSLPPTHQDQPQEHRDHPATHFHLLTLSHLLEPRGLHPQEESPQTASKKGLIRGNASRIASKTYIAATSSQWWEIRARDHIQITQPNRVPLPSADFNRSLLIPQPTAHSQYLSHSFRPGQASGRGEDQLHRSVVPCC